MNPIVGISLKLCAVLSFITMASLIKVNTETFPPGQAVFFRSFFALPVIFVWLLLRGDLRTGLKVNAVMPHFWRGLIGTTAMGLGFAGLGLLPLPEVTAIGYAAPLLTVVFAAMFLGEEVRLFRLSSVALGLIGVLIVVEPRLTLLYDDVVQSTQALGAVLVLLSSVFAALAQIHIRNMVQTEQTSAIVFYFALSAVGLSLLTLPFGWVMPNWSQALILVCAGLTGGMGQIFLTSSYRFAPASVVAPFDYASMLFALLIGFFIFDEVPTSQTLIGAALVVCAGVLIILREARLGKRRSAERQA